MRKIRKPFGERVEPRFLLSGFLISSFLAYYGTIESFARVWSASASNTYSHGLPLFLISLWLSARAWKNIEWNSTEPSMLGVILLTAGSFLWLVASIGGLQAGEQIAFVLIVGAGFWAVLGSQARRFAFPVMLIVGAIPVWDFLGPVLQTLTAHAVGEILQAFGSVSVREGMFILVPNGIFEVEPSCSGVNQVIVACCASALFSHVFRVRFRMACFLFIAAVILAIATNILRIALVIMIGDRVGMDVPVVTDHLWLGWLLFTLTLAPLLFWFRPGCNVQLFNGGKRRVRRLAKSNRKKNRIVSFLALVAALIPPAVAALRPVDTVYAITLPASIGVWKGEKSDDSWRPAVSRADASDEMVYRHADGRRVQVKIYHYNSQRHDREAVNDLNSMGSSDWTVIKEQMRSIDTDESRRFDIKESRLRRLDGKERIVWWWYANRTMRSADPARGKLMGILGTLSGNPGVALFVLASDVITESESIGGDLEEFLLTSLKHLENSAKRPGKPLIESGGSIGE